MTFDEAMNLALALYNTGQPVVLKDKNGNVLHGQETLETITDAKKYTVIPDVDADLAMRAAYIGSKSWKERDGDG